MSGNLKHFWTFFLLGSVCFIIHVYKQTRTFEHDLPVYEVEESENDDKTIFRSQSENLSKLSSDNVSSGNNYQPSINKAPRAQVLYYQPVIDVEQVNERLDDAHLDLDNTYYTMNGIRTKVPNIVHFNWFYPPNKTFSFLYLLCMVSAYQKHQPQIGIFWHTNLPVGPWWNYFMDIAKQNGYKLLMKHLEPPNYVYGNKIKYAAHSSDIVRILLLYKYGGIYLDFDVIVLKSFAPLMNYSVTMSQALETTLNNGAILVEPRAKFIKLWLEQYKNFRSNAKWGYFGTAIPYKLSQQYPELIHVEKGTFMSPNIKNSHYMFAEGLLYDWSQSYCMHIWVRKTTIDFNPDTIKTLNATVGQVTRFIWYNTTELLD